MQVTKTVQAGSLESSDCLVTIEPFQSTEHELELVSSVDKQFHDSIIADITEVIAQTAGHLGMPITGYKIKVEDKGALPFAIKARVKTALERAVAGGSQ